MKTDVVVSAFAVWTPLGVWVNSKPSENSGQGALAFWPEAPLLSDVHPVQRKPHRQGVVLVQLAHALLSARATAAGQRPAPLAETDLLFGTGNGSAEADIEFVEGLRQRGPGFGSPSTFVYTLPTAAPAEVALALGLRGALLTLAAGRASGLFAVARAVAHVGHGRSRACITGGHELGMSGPAAAPGEREIAALFLLESAEAPSEWPRLLGPEVGFDRGRSSMKTDPSAASALLSLAAACASPERGTEGEFFQDSDEGYWARLRCEQALDGPP